jgi:hypothetical protein
MLISGSAVATEEGRYMCHLLRSRAPSTDRLRRACVVRPTDCKSAAGELTSRTGLLLRPWRIVTTVSRSLSSMDARLSGRPATFLRLSVGCALSGQGFAFCDIVA